MSAQTEVWMAEETPPRQEIEAMLAATLQTLADFEERVTKTTSEILTSQIAGASPPAVLVLWLTLLDLLRRAEDLKRSVAVLRARLE
jgi:hypothetical protein